KSFARNAPRRFTYSNRFHIVAKMNKALDEIRAGESRRIASEGGVPVLKKSRWLLLKREENLKTEQRFRLRDLLRYNLKTIRAYLLKGLVGGICGSVGSDEPPEFRELIFR